MQDITIISRRGVVRTNGCGSFTPTPVDGPHLAVVVYARGDVRIGRALGRQAERIGRAYYRLSTGLSRPSIHGERVGHAQSSLGCCSVTVKMHSFQAAILHWAYQGLAHLAGGAHLPSILWPSSTHFPMVLIHPLSSHISTGCSHSTTGCIVMRSRNTAHPNAEAKQVGPTHTYS